MDCWTTDAAQRHGADLERSGIVLAAGYAEGVVLYNAAGVTLLDDAGGTIWQYEPSIYSLTTDGENFYAGTTDGRSSRATWSRFRVRPSTSPRATTLSLRMTFWCAGSRVALSRAWEPRLEGAGTVWTESIWYVVAGRMEVAGRAEGPTAVYLTGHAGVQSSLYKIEVTVEEGLVTLSPLLLVAEMPRGEIVNTIYSYVGAFLAIGTSDGVRIASMEANGSLNVGPISRQSDSGVHDFLLTARTCTRLW